MANNEDFFAIFASRIKERREGRGLSATDAAAALDITRSYLSNIEAQVNTPNAIKILAEMGRIYETSIDYLVGNSSDPRSGDDPEGAAQLFALYDKLSEENRAALIQMAEGMYLRELIALSGTDEGMRQIAIYLTKQSRFGDVSSALD